MHAIFKETTGIKSQDSLFLYLSLREGEYTAPETISRNINNRRPLDKDCLQHIQSNGDWSSGSSPFARAVRDSQDMHTSLASLQKEFLPGVDMPGSCNGLPGSLARFCFCGDYRRLDPPVPEPCFDNPSRFSTRSSIKGIIARSGLVEKIQACLDQYGMDVLERV